MMKKLSWWQYKTIYQIYPRSFMDSNGDGIGDLQGIISKLDYLKDLGVDILWVSPFFKSPQGDWGYDVSDYLGIDPDYGDLHDAEELIDHVHRRGMRVLFDLVLNHTSDQHPWFIQSRSRRDDPKRDWYIWRDGRGNRPPNNWQSILGGSGWHHDPTTNQWYYASFLPFQPDLNYRNPQVIDEIFNIAKYWLDRGVDGFRLDIFHTIFKDEEIRNNPLSFDLLPDNFTSGYFQKWLYNMNQPEAIQFAKEFRQLADSYSPERVLLGELYANEPTILKYLGANQDGLNLVFLWNLLKVPPQATSLRRVLRFYESNFPDPHMPVYVYGNHDSRRLISRIGEDPRVAALLALLQLTARGVPVLYYGEEIGMSGVQLPLADSLDPVGKRFGWLPEFLVRRMNLFINRDECRTPMQWGDTENAGFCPPGTKPWLPIHENYSRMNVKNQAKEEKSLFNIYRRLLHLRKSSAALQFGHMEILNVDDSNDQVLAYLRTFGQENLLILLNFSEAEFDFPFRAMDNNVVFFIGNYQFIPGDIIRMDPWSGLILNAG